MILVDGRFRVGCFLAAMTRIRRPTRLLFDDYAKRDYRLVVERFQRPAAMIDRMAVFDLEPRPLSAMERVRTLRARFELEIAPWPRPAPRPGATPTGVACALSCGPAPRGPCGASSTARSPSPRSLVTFAIPLSAARAPATGTW